MLHFTTNYVWTFCQFTEIMHTVVCLYGPPVLNTAHNVLIDGTTCNWFHIFIFTSGSSALRAPMLWFIDLTVATWYIQYTFLCQFFFSSFFLLFFSDMKTDKSAIFVWHENGRRRLLGAQSINRQLETGTRERTYCFTTPKNLPSSGYII